MWDMSPAEGSHPANLSCIWAMTSYSRYRVFFRLPTSQQALDPAQPEPRPGRGLAAGVPRPGSRLPPG